MYRKSLSLPRYGPCPGKKDDKPQNRYICSPNRVGAVKKTRKNVEKPI